MHQISSHETERSHARRALDEDFGLKDAARPRGEAQRISSAVIERHIMRRANRCASATLSTAGSAACGSTAIHERTFRIAPRRRRRLAAAAPAATPARAAVPARDRRGSPLRRRDDGLLLRRRAVVLLARVLRRLLDEGQYSGGDL